MKQRINSEFIAAFKAKNFMRKDILGMLKTKITEAEKKDGKELSDDQIFNVINSSLKQVEQTILATKINSESKIYKEAMQEKEILLSFLPSQMTHEELYEKVNEMFCDENSSIKELKQNQALGIIMGNFKKNYNGRYNSNELKSIIDRVLEEHYPF